MPGRVGAPGEQTQLSPLWSSQHNSVATRQKSRASITWGMFGMPREAALVGSSEGIRVCSHPGEVVVAVLLVQDPHQAQQQPKAPCSPQKLLAHPKICIFMERKDLNTLS